MGSVLNSVKKYFLKFWDAGFIFRNAFVPLVVLTLYFALFAYLLPDGVNRVFASDLWKPSLVLVGLAGLAAAAFWKFKGEKRLIPERPADKLSSADPTLLLLPLTPVVQYVLNNQDILSLGESFYVLAIFAAFSAVFIVALPKLLGVLGSTRTLMILGLALAFTLLNMPALSQQFAWFEVGSLKIQLAVFGGVFLVSWFLYDLNYKKLLYFLIAVYFVSNSVSQAFIPKDEGASRDQTPFTGHKLVELVGEREPVSTPNIYLLIYDAYVTNETLLDHGIDNSAQESYLKEQGFKLYPKTYSIGAASLDTMSRVFNASAEYYGNIRRAASGDGVVQNLLKDFGYETYGLFPSDYFFRGYGSNYSFYFPPNITPSGNLLWEAVLMGEFKFDLEFDRVPYEQFVEEKLRVFKEMPNNPRFIDMHTNIPNHSQDSGSCRPNEIDLYKERLAEANLEMRRDLETLIKNDPSAIVIVASDHGPYLTKNCTGTGDPYSNSYDISEISRLDIQDRFGTFLAIRWPGGDFEEYDDITVLQDLFPAVFAYLFKDGALLEARIDPVTVDLSRVSGVYVQNGVIYGGSDDGEPLFISE